MIATTRRRTDVAWRDWLSAPTVAQVTIAMTLLCAAIAIGALVVLGVRSAVRLDFWWDTPRYHIPVAAFRAGIPLNYTPDTLELGIEQGFPPLPEFVQGVLWRITGNLNATGVVNFLAFALFLAYAHVVLKASFWVVGLISLTAPLVLIHTTVDYVDLFSNALFAIGICSIFAMFLFPERWSRAVLIGALGGLIGGAWSKYQLTPLVGLLFVVLVAMLWQRLPPTRAERLRLAALVVGAIAIASIPYVKNWIVYANPLWPIRVPFLDIFPYTWNTPVIAAGERPPQLAGAPQPQLFFMSLFEITNSSSYIGRERWVIDMSNGYASYRMGGFWVGGVVTYLAAAVTMLLVALRRRGAIAVGAIVVTLLIVSFLPQSHELRYYMFIPLTLGATVGMLLPSIRTLLPRVAPVILGVILVLFLHMASVNAYYFSTQPLDYTAAARSWGAIPYWSLLTKGQTYCAVGMEPFSVFLTGPTMTEFGIVDRATVDTCPKGMQVLEMDGLHGLAP